jgi:aminomethyltransferase
VKRISEPDPSDVKTYHFIEGRAAGIDAIIARTGYTGEDGFELYVPAEGAETVWNALMEKGRGPRACSPRGSARATRLRLEMCFPLYGNDIDETTHPFEAGLGWVVKLDKPTAFVGQNAAAGAEGRRARPGGWSRIEMRERGIARQGYPVVVDGARGRCLVTSGTKSPSTGEAIALAYVPKSHAKAGSSGRGLRYGAGRSRRRWSSGRS